MLVPALESVQSDSIIDHLQYRSTCRGDPVPFLPLSRAGIFYGSQSDADPTEPGKNDLFFIVPVSLIKEPLRIDLGMISGTYQINH